MMLNKMIMAENIKRLRCSAGITQSGLSEMLNISAQSVSKWECGNSVPDIDNLCILSKIFGVSIEYIIGSEYETRNIMIGIDGGGSKTEIVSFDSDGKIVRRILKEPSNPNTVGIEKSLEVISSGISEALPSDCRLCGLYVGGSGFLTANNGEKIQDSLLKLYPGITIKCKTDILNVIASCTDEKDCIAVICGTGSVVFAKEGEKLIKYGGWGPFLSKSGSGYDIGRDGIYYALMEKEGRGSKTVITDYIEEKSGVQAENLIAQVYKNDQSFIASFASCVFRAFSSGDEVAAAIIDENAKALSEVINYASCRHKIRKVILSGGIITNENAFAEAVKKYLDKNIRCIITEKPQIYGACVLAAQLCECDSGELRNNLINDYRRIARGENNA